MLWIALHLPLLPLEAFCATLSAQARQRPVVLVAEHHVSAVNAAAAQRGVRPGHKRATALALAADMQVAPADAARDAAALHAVAHAALAFTPMVVLDVANDGSHTVLLEVQASLRLFGGLPALLARLAVALAPLGHHVQRAAAPTPLGAALLARWGGPGGAQDFLEGPHLTQLPALRQLLGGAPVWLLGPGRAHWEALQGMGLHTLADLQHLPRSGLARRFSESLLEDLDNAFGQRADPRQPLRPPPVFNTRLELFARAENTEQVLAGAGVLLARLVAWAQAQHARIGAFTLRMLHEPRRQTGVPATELHIELAEPALAAAHLHMLLRERLARATLAAPTLELVLHCRHLVRAAPPNAELFPSRQSDAEGLLRLLERLRARLGNAQVQRVVPVADHRPERASRVEPALRPLGLADMAGGVPAAATLPLHRPVWLLPEPVPLATRDALPVLQGRSLQILQGPERIESGWWDGDLALRDYYIAQEHGGALVWVFKDRLSGGSTPACWFLHGRFA